MTYVMMTLPRKYLKSGRKWIEYFESIDCHKWIVALEHGKGGLEHWQIRFKVRGCDTKEGKMKFFEQWKAMCNEVHIEFTENWCDYERKEGNFITSDDNHETIKIRFGALRPLQRQILDIVETQGDREIDTFLDKRGNHGKSWLTIHLWEKGLAFPVFTTSANQTVADICSGYRGQKYIVIDIPRASKVPKDLYEVLERVKDGLVHDSRYHDTTRNIRGAKIIIFTNQALDEKRLSYDRWRLHGITGDVLT